MNKAEKSLRWVVNQISDFTPKNNEEKMLVAIKLYSEAGAEEIKRLEAENAALRERLEKAVEFPYSISETVYYVCKISPHIYEICRGIIVELSIDKRGVIWTRAKYEDGSEYLHCSCNNFVNLYKTPEAAEERLKELKGEKQ